VDLFERQEAVRRRSRRLLALFLLAVLGIVAAVNLVVWFFVGQVVASGGLSTGPLLAFTTLATVLLIGGASLYRTMTLRKGGGAVAMALGGSPVPVDTHDPGLRRLLNVVEEMAIASGSALPQVFVLEDEPRINAFAAGFGGPDAAIAVTRGALDRLNRAELQGVVAHEFGHIINADIRLNLRLMGLLFGITMLGIVARHLMSVRSRDSRDGGAVPLIAVGVALLVIGGIGQLGARLIKAGISRQREFLADASALQYTRDPEGLVGAFLKIAGVPGQGRLQAPEAEEISHMLFEDGIGFSGWMATHPPLLARIQALRPGFKPVAFEQALARQQLPAPNGLDEDHAKAFAEPPSLPSETAAIRVSPAAVAEGLGHWRLDDVQRAQAVIAAIPGVLDRAARDRDEAMPLLFGLLFSGETTVQQKQRFELKARMGERMVGQSADYAERVHGLHAALRLPLAMLAVATLKRRSHADVEAAADVCTALSHADGRITLLEYGLAQLLRAELQASAAPEPAWRRPQLKLSDVEGDVVQLLSVLAHAGHAQPADAQRAFMAGLPRVLPQSSARYAPPRRCRRRWRPCAPDRSGVDQLGGALGDHDRRRIGVAADQLRHYGGVDHAQALHAAHPQLRVDDGVRIAVRAHRAGADRVVDRLGLAADEHVDGRVTLRFRALPRRGAVPGREGLLGEDLAREPHAFAHHLEVEAFRVAEVVGFDARLGRGVGVGEVQAAAALRPQEAGVHGEAVAGQLVAAVVVELRRHEVELQVGALVLCKA
jgi:Zn-dependent protease with chaperone function